MDLWPNENQRRLCIPSYKKLYKYSLNCVLFLTVILTWIFFVSRQFPNRQNGNDCGVFICKYADFLSQGKPPTFRQVQVHNYIYISLKPDS